MSRSRTPKRRNRRRQTRQSRFEPLETRRLLTGTGDIALAAWQDDNKDGVRDAQELPDAGLPVELYQSEDTIIGNMDDRRVAVEVTDEEGWVDFKNKASGNYFLLVKNRPETTFSPRFHGLDPTRDNDVRENGLTDLIKLAENEVRDDLGAGSFRKSPLPPGEVPDVAPWAAPDRIQIPEDESPTTIDVMANDAFGTMGRLVAEVGQPDQGGTVSVAPDKSSVIFEPEPNFHGTARFTYVVQDWNGNAAESEVVVTVTPMNDNPDAQNDHFEFDYGLSEPKILDVLHNDLPAPDPDEDLRIVSVNAPDRLGVEIVDEGKNVRVSGNLQPGDAIDFQYTIEDGNGGRATATVTVSIREPVVSIGGHVWYDEDADGKRSGSEKGVKDILVELWYKGQGTDSDKRHANTRTAADGTFVFAGAPEGMAYFVFRPPLGVRFTTQDAGTNDLDDSDADPATGKTDPFLAEGGVIDYSHDAGVLGDVPDHGSIWPMGGNGFDYVSKVDYDKVGNAVVAGTCAGLVDFDPGPAQRLIDCSRSGESFVGTYSTDAALIDVTLTKGLSIYDLDVEGESIYLTGLDENVGQLRLLQLDSAFNLNWDHTIEGSGWSEGVSVEADPTGGVHVAAHLSGGVFDLDPGPAEALVDATTGMTPVVFRYDQEGALDWVAQLDGDGSANYINDLAVSIDAQVTVMLTVSEPFDADPGDGTFLVEPRQGTYDVSLVNLNDNGAFRSARSLGGNGTDLGGGIVYHGPSLYLTATFENTIFDGIQALAESAGASDILVGRIDDGELAWITSVGGTGRDESAAIDAYFGSVMVAGLFSGSVDLSPVPGEDRRESVGGADALLVHLTSDGDYVSGLTWGSSGMDLVMGLATLANGSFWVGGLMGGDVLINDGDDLFEVPAIGGGGDGLIFNCGDSAPDNPNRPPIAEDDAYAVDADTMLIVATPGVLFDDTDPDGDTIYVDPQTRRVTSRRGVTVDIAGDGSFTYDAREVAFGKQLPVRSSFLDSFEYLVTDGRGVDRGRVTITVRGLNDPPEAQDDELGHFPRNEVFNSGEVSVLENDTDPDVGDRLTVVDFDSTSEHGARVAVDSDGTFVYDPRVSPYIVDEEGEYGFASDSFTYTTQDEEGNTDTATVVISLLAPPVGHHQPFALTDEFETLDQAPLARNVLNNDIDHLDHALQVASFSPKTELGGTVSMTADGRMTYDPSNSEILQQLGEGEQLIDSFRYEIVDEWSMSDQATVYIVVKGSNNAPAVGDDRYDADAGTPLRVDGQAGLLVNDSDAEGSLEVVPEVVTSSNGATVTIRADGSFEFDFTTVPWPADDPDDPDDREEPWVDSFVYHVVDGGGSEATGTVTISLTWSNRNPIAVPDEFDVEIGEVLFVETLGVLKNDREPDGDIMRVVGGETTTELGGTVIISPSGGFSYNHSAIRDLLELKHALGETPVDTFTYQVVDGRGGSDTEVVSITIEPVAEKTSANDDEYTIPHDGSNVKLPVLDNDTSASGQQTDLRVTGVTSDADGVDVHIAEDGRSIFISPNGLLDGHYSFQYTIEDGQGGSATGTVSITVEPAAEKTSANDDEYTIPHDGSNVKLPVLDNDTSASGQQTDLRVTGVTSDAEGVDVHIAEDGRSIFISPNGLLDGRYSFQYTIEDGQGGTATGIVSITIEPAAEKTSANDDEFTVSQHGNNVKLPVLDNDTSASGQQTDLRVTGVTSDAEGVDVRIAEDGRSILISPNGRLHGQYSFEYTIDDGRGGSDVGQVTIHANGHTNPINSLDINNDGIVSPIDVIIGFNRLNEHGPENLSQMDGFLGHFLDVNGDGFHSPIDPLIIINFVNLTVSGGEAEPLPQDVAARQVASVARQVAFRATIPQTRSKFERHTRSDDGRETQDNALLPTSTLTLNTQPSRERHDAALLSGQFADHRNDQMLTLLDALAADVASAWTSQTDQSRLSVSCRVQ